MKRPSKLRCVTCGKEIHGVPRIAKLPKSKSRPERPFGAKLCSKCMRIKIIMGVQK